jgi:hypothetical protein
LASCLNYSFSAGTALFGGPLINKIGIKYSALFCGIFMFLNGSAYYCNVKYKLDAYLLAARVCLATSLRHIPQDQYADFVRHSAVSPALSCMSPSPRQCFLTRTPMSVADTLVYVHDPLPRTFMRTGKVSRRLRVRGLTWQIWASMRNSGAIVGGVINFANNANSATAGGVAVSTYLIFMA